MLRQRPRWLGPLSAVLAAIGVLISAYLTFEHFTANATLACSVNGMVDCAKVTTSPWSRVMGVPVAPLGLAFFVAMLASTLPRAWRVTRRGADTARLVAATSGVLMVLYLVWAELFRIHAICLWCTGVHVVAFALWVVILFGTILSEPVTATSDNG